MSAERANRYPTPREFVDEWDAKTDNQRVAAAERIINDAQMASRCFVMAHEDHVDLLERRHAILRERAEAAEAKVARVEALREHLASYGPGTPMENIMGKQSVTIETLLKMFDNALDGDA